MSLISLVSFVRISKLSISYKEVCPLSVVMRTKAVAFLSSVMEFMLSTRDLEIWSCLLTHLSFHLKCCKPLTWIKMKFSSMLPFKHLLAVLNKIFSVFTSFEKLRWWHSYITHVGWERFQNLKLKLLSSKPHL